MTAAFMNFLPDSFQKIFPGAQPWVESLKTTEIATVIQTLFAHIEVLHILGLFLLGGATIMTCLRLIGVGLVEVPPSVIEKNARPWLIVGVIMAIASGVTIGLSNAEKLYNNSAFLFKMIAMIAGIVFSFFVMVPVAKRDGVVTAGSKIGLVVAFAIWIFGILIMLAKPGSNVAVFHVIYAGFFIGIAVLAGRARWIYLIGAALIVLVWQVLTHTAITVNGDIAKFDMVNRGFLMLSAAWVLGAFALDLFGKHRRQDSKALTKLIGYATILVWVTVGAGGRWIGLT